VEITIDRRFRGPDASGNGGYTCGRVAAFVDGDAEVTLRLPPPLGRPLRVEGTPEGVELYDDGELVAEGRPATLELEPPSPVTFEAAERAAADYPGFAEHAFPNCFVCGPQRMAGDGLRIFASPVAGREVVAAPWIPTAALADGDGVVRGEFVWAALDCPGAFAVGFGRGELVLGRLTVRVERSPRAGERCVVVGWPLGAERRKSYAGTALYSVHGERYGVGRATWIEPRPA
jgi:hypothetical protein